jgi:hypothetical protein
MNYIPVDGTVLDASRAIAVPGFPDRTVVAPDMDATTFAPDSISINSATVSANVMASAGFENLLVSGSATYFLFDLFATQSVATPDPKHNLDFVVMGVGLRVGVRGLNVKGAASVSLGALAASVNLSASSTAFSFVTPGIGAQGLTFVRDLAVTAGGAFNVTVMQLLGAAAEQLMDYMADPANAAAMTPLAVGVVLAADTLVESTAASYGFALRSIKNGSSLLTALEKGTHTLPQGVQRIDEVVAATYASVLGSTNPVAQPSSVQKTLAGQLANCGP